MSVSFSATFNAVVDAYSKLQRCTLQKRTTLDTTAPLILAEQMASRRGCEPHSGSVFLHGHTKRFPTTQAGGCEKSV